MEGKLLPPPRPSLPRLSMPVGIGLCGLVLAQNYFDPPTADEPPSCRERAPQPCKICAVQLAIDILLEARLLDSTWRCCPGYGGITKTLWMGFWSATGVYSIMASRQEPYICHQLLKSGEVNCHMWCRVLSPHSDPETTRTRYQDLSCAIRDLFRELQDWWNNMQPVGVASQVVYDRGMGREWGLGLDEVD